MVLMMMNTMSTMMDDGKKWYTMKMVSNIKFIYLLFTFVYTLDRERKGNKLGLGPCLM